MGGESSEFSADLFDGFHLGLHLSRRVIENLNERQNGAAFSASDFPGLGDAINGKNLHG